MARAVIFGGLGKLGSALAEQMRNEHDVLAYGKSPICGVDVTDELAVLEVLTDTWPTIAINCAGILSLQSERDRRLAWSVNVGGAAAVARACETLGIALTHISTDYVFDGESGNYREEDPPNPVNYYGLTKMAGEVAVRSAKPSAQIVRAPFRYDGPWSYSAAFSDQVISGRWMAEVVPDIVALALSRRPGTWHLGGSARTVLEMAREVSPATEPCLRSSFTQFRLPADVSLDSTKWRRSGWARTRTG